MGNIIRIYRQGDLIAIEAFAEKFNLNPELVTGLPPVEKYKDWDMIIANSDDIPVTDNLEKLYFDGPTVVENLRSDNNFDKVLMRPHEIRKRYLKKQEDIIDAELAKETPDGVIIARANREKEKAKSYPDPSWYPIALSGLDERIGAGDPDKPLIRQKLQDKININGVNKTP